MLKREHQLHETGDSGSRLQMPKLLFTEPTRSGPAAGDLSANTLPSAPTSMGSPSAVPVPCASRYWRSSGSSPAFNESACNHGLLRASIGRGETATSTILIGRSATDHRENPIPILHGIRKRFSTIMPVPSARTNPSASSENGLHRPSGAIMRLCDKGYRDFGFENEICAPGESQMRLFPSQALAGEMHGHQ